MEEECVEMYDMTGTFFSTDKAYHIPYPIERDFQPLPDMLSDSESESDDCADHNTVAPAESAEDDGEDASISPALGSLGLGLPEL
jgi:hypothetical protein